jgi:hypothetical protein
MRARCREGLLAKCQCISDFEARNAFHKAAATMRSNGGCQTKINQIHVCLEGGSTSDGLRLHIHHKPIEAGSWLPNNDVLAPFPALQLSD